ncbi:hypothetical protein [Borborobacter arsenicus]|nr:hypothetical protein [Pseudaminobacter arsenicus]
MRNVLYVMLAAIFTALTQIVLVQLKHPDAVWLWCSMLGLCG